jgi:hypothetical protein
MKSLSEGMTFGETAPSYGGGFFLFILVLAFFAIIVQWKLFVKAGQPGWAVLIPIYNAIIYLRIIGRPAMWLFVYIACFILYFAGAIMMVNGPTFISSILLFAGIMAIMIVAIIDTNRLSKSFGKGIGFTLGLIFLGIIFQAILAFGDSKYIGPNGVGEVVNDNPDILHS